MSQPFVLLEALRESHPVSRLMFHETYDEFFTSILLKSGFVSGEAEAFLHSLDPVLFGESEAFSYDPEKGAFRDFLHRIFLRCLPEGKMIPADFWNEEWRKHVVAQSLMKLQGEMDPNSWLAFEVYVIEGKPAREAAVLSAMSPEMVYLTRTRALKRLRILREEFQAV